MGGSHSDFCTLPTSLFTSRMRNIDYVLRLLNHVRKACVYYFMMLVHAYEEIQFGFKVYVEREFKLLNNSLKWKVQRLLLTSMLIVYKCDILVFISTSL